MGSINDNFNKAQAAKILSCYSIGDEDLEKGGEGSKGGKVIGHTKSGKAIYEDHNHESHKKFTSADHMDASDTHMSSDKSTLDNNHKDEASAHHYRQTDEYKADLAKRKKKAEKVEKSEPFSILESIATDTFEKSADGAVMDQKKQTEQSKKTAPDIEKEAKEDKEEPATEESDEDDKDTDEVKEKKKIQKGIDSLIVKGEITEKIAYGYGGSNEAFKFVKTGAEIKSKLPAIVAVLQVEKAVLLSQMTDTQTAIGIAPTNINASQFVKDIVFNTYPWSMIDAPYDDILKKRSDPTEQNQLCEKYNSLCYLCRSISEDIVTAQTVLANVEDKKQYTLSVNQLVALGFTDAPIQKSEEWWKLEKAQENTFGIDDFLNIQKARVTQFYS